jgi:hypothetical protein
MTNICTPDSHQTRLDKNLRPWWWGWWSVLVEVSRYIRLRVAVRIGPVSATGRRYSPSVPALAARRRRSAICLYSVRVTHTDQAPAVAAR